MADAREIYKSFVPKVNDEDGCIMYLPTIDHETDIPTQIQDSNIITVIEKWESMDFFKAHLSAPHVIKFREQIKGVVEKVSIKVLKEML